jgi:hypothetical protein
MANANWQMVNGKWCFWTFAFCLLPFAMPIVVRAEFLPPAHDLFRPLRADPRELQYSLRLVEPVSHKLLGEASVGDYLGLWRWSLGDGGVFQVSAGGGAFGRFDLAGTNNEFQVVDYYGNLPFDWRIGRWSTRVLVYHTSSHLGDDFMNRTGQFAEKHTWDNLKLLQSFDAAPNLRIYGGYNYVFRTLPGGIGRHALQCGFETQSEWLARGHVQFYWANDLQSWERAHWNPTFNSQAGLNLADKPSDSRAVSLFLEYTAGRQPQGQFYLQQESRWNLGIQFHLT